MRTTRVSRLCFKLGIVVFFTFLPVVGFFLWHLEVERRVALDAEGAFLDRAAQRMSIEHGDAVNDARALVQVIASLKEVRDGRWDECGPLLSRINKEYERYVFIGVVDRVGDLRCSSISSPPGIHVRDRPWFQRVASEKTFVIGGFAVGRSSGKASIHFAVPIIKDGEFVGAVNAAVDLFWLARSISHFPQRANTAFFVLDGDGKILARSPSGEDGRVVSAIEGPSDFLGALREQAPGAVFETSALDGVLRIVRATTVLEGIGRGQIVGVATIDKAASLAAINDTFRRGLIALASIKVAALVLLAIALHRIVLYPLGRIWRAAQQVRSGDLSTRLDLTGSNDEIGRLASAFDAMTESLQQREKDRAVILRQELLLREVAHRVKNHLATLASMMRMEARDRDVESATVLRAMDRRISAVADLYSLLEDSSGTQTVRLAGYVDRICRNLARFAADERRKIDFVQEICGDAAIDAKKAVSLGILINEMVANSLKHAFPDGGGRIAVRIDARHRDEITLDVSDNGGAAWNDIRPERSFGLRLIDAMIQQLGASHAVARDSGTRHRIVFAA